MSTNTENTPSLQERLRAAKTEKEKLDILKAEPISLHAKLRLVKTEVERLDLLQDEVKKQRERVAREKKEEQSKESAEKRKERNRHIYSLGVLLMQFMAKATTRKKNKEKVDPNEDIAFNTICQKIVENNGFLEDKDFIRGIEALDYIGISLAKAAPQYAILKEKQKEKAKAMRASRTAKRKEAIAKDQG